MPFSPSTQPQLNVQSKPVMKGPNDSGSKKLVGPGQGGIKKPPKYNEFNMPIQEQSQSQTFQSDNFGFSSSFDTGFTSNPSPSTNFNNTSLFTQQSTPISNNNQFNLGVNSSNDPFAEV